MSTPEEKAAARAAERERRQARIKASAATRLSKITGSAGTQDFKPPVATARPAPSPEPRAVAPASEAADPDVPSGDQLLKFLSKTPGSESPQEDPLLAYLTQAMGQLPSSPPSSSPPRPPAAQSQSFADAQSRSKQRSRNDFAWDALRFAASVLIGLYAALVNPWGLMLPFATLQAFLVGAKAVFGHHAGLSSVPFVGPFLGMLPKARQRQLSFAGSLFHAARDAYRDFAIIIFVFGLFGLGGRDYARPV